MTVTHDKSAVGLVKTKYMQKINPNLNPNRSPNLTLIQTKC